jgi:hypothetical protein
MGLTKAIKEAIESSRFNSVEVVQTSVGTSATLIETPEGAKSFSVFHATPGAVLHFGVDDQITAAGATTAPLEYLARLEFDGVKSNSNNLYGIVASGTLTVYCVGNY